MLLGVLRVRVRGAKDAPPHLEHVLHDRLCFAKIFMGDAVDLVESAGEGLAELERDVVVLEMSSSRKKERRMCAQLLPAATERSVSCVSPAGRSLW